VARSLFTTVSLAGDLQEALAQVPASAGVAKILAEDDRSLLIGRPANLRKWAGSHLGLATKRAAGKRPPTNLLPIARAVAHAASTSEFHQRLVYERAMAIEVPSSKRRDLKPPVYLHLDPGERFPRVTIREGGSACLFGPFRQRRAAEKAVRHLHRLFPLRPCDFTFEPDPALPLGVGCVYAQVRTCAAPCLARLTEDAYRTLAREAAGFLGEPESRPSDAEAAIPAWVAAEATRAVVAEVGKTSVELYPVVVGSVLAEARIDASLDDVDEAAARLSWEAPAESHDDKAWLCAWLHLPKRRGVYLVPRGDGGGLGLGAALREALAQRESGRPVRGVIT
jgi:hypothetical protein